jgi:predicted transcriptional regulator
VSWLAKLTPKQVRKAFQLKRKGWSQARISEHFGISTAAVSMLLQGKTYKHVNREDCLPKAA